MTLLKRILLLGTVAAISGGCSTYVTSTEAGDFNKCVKDVATKLKASLAEIQAVEVGDAVDDFAKSDKRRLEDLHIDPKLSDVEVKAITCQFDFLVAYSECLKAATTPGASWDKSVTKVTSAGSKLMGDTQSLDNTVSGHEVITDANVATFNKDATGVAKAVSAIGQDALTLYGEEKASKVAAAVDPDIQKYCADLEAVISSDPEAKGKGTGLAGILFHDYDERIAHVKFLASVALPPGGSGDANYVALVQARTAILNEYTGLVRSEHDGLANLGALRKAVEEIAKAHHALANKDDATFREKLDNVDGLVRSVGAEAPASDDDKSD